MTLSVAHCPVTNGAGDRCAWRSDPLGEDAARERQRAHVAQHSHGELVETIWHRLGNSIIDVYEKKES